MPGRAASTLFHWLYGPLAPAYDLVSRVFFAGEWAEWQRCAVELVRGPAVLEIGFGTGSVAAELAADGLDVYGVDPSAQMLRLARRKLIRRGLSAHLTYGSAQALPFPSGRFDSLVSTFPSSYILDRRTWAEVHRVLRPGGRFVVLLGGELRPTSVRTRVLHRFHRMVYSTPRAAPPPLPETDGFILTEQARETTGGTAHILLAEKTSVD